MTSSNHSLGTFHPHTARYINESLATSEAHKSKIHSLSGSDIIYPTHAGDTVVLSGAVYSITLPADCFHPSRLGDEYNFICMGTSDVLFRTAQNMYGVALIGGSDSARIHGVDNINVYDPRGQWRVRIVATDTAHVDLWIGQAADLVIDGESEA